MNEFSPQRYSRDEVNRIMRRAFKLENEDTISYRDLIDSASEIGLDPPVVEAAIEQEQRKFKKEKIRKSRLRRRKAGFYWHLWSYLIVNAVLLIVNNFTPGPGWFQWSVLGWGIGLAFHLKAIYFSHGKRFENKIKLRPKRVEMS